MSILKNIKYSRNCKFWQVWWGRPDRFLHLKYVRLCIKMPCLYTIAKLVKLANTFKIWKMTFPKCVQMSNFDNLALNSWHLCKYLTAFWAYCVISHCLKFIQKNCISFGISFLWALMSLSSNNKISSRSMKTFSPIKLNSLIFALRNKARLRFWKS